MAAMCALEAKKMQDHLFYFLQKTHHQKSLSKPSTGGFKVPVGTTKRSLLKTISYRVLATITLLVISYLVTGRLELAGAIVSIDIIVKTALYYMHERVWGKIRYGLQKKRRQ